MAITAVTSCLGPPPLPPGKRFLLQRSAKKLSSSTYRSFRDPAVEAWIPGTLQSYSKDKFNRRDKERSNYIGNIVRSRSEGNLTRKYYEDNVINSPLSPLDKCIKAIYGSWRNLMQREFVFFFILFFWK